jgi:lipid II:glycine glycyltransferase (peptidoglycan interpeptide bridge formation enzyme)
MFQAFTRGNLVGAHLWYKQGEIAYSHLAAMNPLGYELMASYALYWFALEYFSGKVRWLDLGSAAGVESKNAAGLDSFKKGWSTGTRTAYLCGRIFDRVKYEEISRARGIEATNYFPAYRRGEFI